MLTDTAIEVAALQSSRSSAGSRQSGDAATRKMFDMQQARTSDVLIGERTKWIDLRTSRFSRFKDEPLTARRSQAIPAKQELATPCSAGLVVLAGGLNPIPFRTRPLNPPAPMVLHLKMRESRSLPGLQSTDEIIHEKPSQNAHRKHQQPPAHTSGRSRIWRWPASRQGKSPKTNYRGATLPARPKIDPMDRSLTVLASSGNPDVAHGPTIARYQISRGGAAR